jgi:polar amino acid transport system substrate-binding protein
LTSAAIFPSRPPYRGVLAAVAILLLAGLTLTARAETPSLWDPARKMEKPDLSGLRQIRFLTEDDFPPFNFATPDGRLAGFNIDLARAICEELDFPCTVQRRSWELLLPSLDDSSGDAVIAALAMTREMRAKADFTAPYLLTPARFAMRADTILTEATPEAIGDSSVAVVAGSAHEAFLKAFFPKAQPQAFETAEKARNELKAGHVNALFGDAVGLSYWLIGADAAKCCVFKGGPFVDSAFFGDGMGIAVKKGNVKLRRALDYALARLSQRGVYAELYLKYFPLSPY